MIDVDLRKLLQQLNSFCTRSLEAAAGLCVSRGHYEVTIEHFLRQAMDDPAADMQLVLRHFEVEPARVCRLLDRAIEELRSGNAGKPVFSPPVVEWLEELPAKALQGGKCLARLERLEQLGHELRRPEADYLRDDIYELRGQLPGSSLPDAVLLS